MKTKNTSTMRKLLASILCVVMLVCMMSIAIGASAAEANQKVMNAKNGVVQIQEWFVDPEAGVSQYLGYGSGFLINEETVITCEHVVSGFTDGWYVEWTQMINNTYGLKRTVEEVKSLLEHRVTVDRDVWVRGTIRKASAEMDFAILTLDEKIYNREILPLRKSSTLKQTEAVYALGFPGDMDDIKVEHTYGADEVAISSGSVNQVAKITIDYLGINNVEHIEHSALITPGNSGGPLVDANGAVVGVNAVCSDTRNLSVSIDQVIATLDALGIEWDEYSSSYQPVVSDKTNKTNKDNEEEAVETTEEEEVEATEKPSKTDNNKTDDEEEDEGEEEAVGFFENTTNIILVAVAGVVLILVIVIIAVVSSNKKKAQPVAAAPASRPMTPPAGGFNQPGGFSQTGGFNQARPQTPAAPVATMHTPPVAQVAGETTVLNQGAGETTVLSKKVNGGTLIRKKNGESVTVSSEIFVIGRERKSVNYCIADNSSISRSHAKLIVKNGATYLVDMGAANGTYVNGVKAEPRHEVLLKNGDKITLADEDLEFRI